MGFIRRSVHDAALIKRRREAILAHLSAASSPCSAREISLTLGFTLSDTNNDLNRLLDLGKIARPALGRWEIARER